MEDCSAGTIDEVRDVKSSETLTTQTSVYKKFKKLLRKVDKMLEEEQFIR